MPADGATPGPGNAIDFPSLEAVVDALKDVAQVAELDPAAPLSETHVDSLDLLDWSYMLQEEYEVVVPDKVMEQITPSQSVEQIYELLKKAVMTGELV